MQARALLYFLLTLLYFLLTQRLEHRNTFSYTGEAQALCLQALAHLFLLLPLQLANLSPAARRGMI